MSADISQILEPEDVVHLFLDLLDYCDNRVLILPISNTCFPNLVDSSPIWMMI